ncbi:Bacteriophage lysis protein [compost metagenome]
MTKYLLAAAAALLLVSILAFWRLDHVSASLTTQTKRVGELEASIASRKETQRLLTQLDTEHTQEINDARAKNKELLDCLSTGCKRLSVVAKCPAVRPTTGAASMDDAEARAELDPAHARRIVAIPTDGDDAIRQLTALQDYVNQVCLRQQPAK